MTQRLLFLFLAVLCSFGFSSCRSTNQFLKAKPAPLSSFLEHRGEMSKHRERAPFHKVWSNPDAAVRQRATAQKEIFIAPVSLEHLRPVKKALVRNEIRIGSIDRREKEMAERLRAEFAEAFRKSPAPRYRLASAATPESVTLELALVELNPTSPKGNAVKTAAKFVVGPLAGLGGIFTKGNVAVEGRVRNTATGEVVFEFADNEADLMTFYTVRDFRPYGHAVHAMKAWAEQFEQFVRTGPGHRVKDGLCFTLSPY